MDECWQSPAEVEAEFEADGRGPACVQPPYNPETALLGVAILGIAILGTEYDL